MPRWNQSKNGEDDQLIIVESLSYMFKMNDLVGNVPLWISRKSSYELHISLTFDNLTLSKTTVLSQCHSPFLFSSAQRNNTHEMWFLMKYHKNAYILPELFHFDSAWLTLLWKVRIFYLTRYTRLCIMLNDTDVKASCINWRSTNER